MSNLTKLIANHDKCTYNTISNEILLNKRYCNEVEQRLSCGARGLFWTMINLPNDWNVTEKGLATITGESEYSIKKLLKELKQWGYVDYQMIQNEKGLFTKRIFTIREVVNGEIDINKCIFASSDTISSRVDSQSVDIQSDGIQSGGFHGQYNNIINNNIENNDLILNNNINTYTNSKEFEQENSSKQKSMDPLHVSNELATSSFSKNLKITKQDWAALDKNQEKNIANIMAVTDPMNIPKETRRQKKEKEIKNLVQQMENEKGDSIKTVDTQIAHTMGELTEEDNELSRAMGAAKELLELNKAVNKSNLQKMNNVKQMQKEADRLIKDADVAKWFKDYLDVKIHKTGLMAKPTVGLLYDDLKNKSCDNKQTMVIILKEAIKFGWNGFYVNDNVQKQVENLNKVQQLKDNFIPEDEDEYVELLDENGNPIKF